MKIRWRREIALNRGDQETRRVLGHSSVSTVEQPVKAFYLALNAFDRIGGADLNRSVRRDATTVAALIALNRPDQLRSHFTRARDNGVTQEELVETITHLAFYAGWPNAVSAVGVAKEVFEKK